MASPQLHTTLSWSRPQPPALVHPPRASSEGSLTAQPATYRAQPQCHWGAASTGPSRLLPLGCRPSTQPMTAQAASYRAQPSVSLGAPQGPAGCPAPSRLCFSLARTVEPSPSPRPSLSGGWASYASLNSYGAQGSSLASYGNQPSSYVQAASSHGFCSCLPPTHQEQLTPVAPTGPRQPPMGPSLQPITVALWGPGSFLQCPASRLFIMPICPICCTAGAFSLSQTAAHVAQPASSQLREASQPPVLAATTPRALAPWGPSQLFRPVAGSYEPKHHGPGQPWWGSGPQLRCHLPYACCSCLWGPTFTPWQPHQDSVVSLIGCLCYSSGQLARLLLTGQPSVAYSVHVPGAMLHAQHPAPMSCTRPPHPGQLRRSRQKAVTCRGRVLYASPAPSWGLGQGG